MITKEHYDKFIQYRDVLKLFYDTGQYVGGCDTLFDYLEQQGMTGGYPIDRNCSGCKSGFLKTTYKMILYYEEQNNNG